MMFRSLYLSPFFVVGVVLVLLGAYRKGVRAEQYAARMRTLNQVRRNQRVKESVDEEIRSYRRPDSDMSVVDRLRQEWSRDSGPQRV